MCYPNPSPGSDASACSAAAIVAALAVVAVAMLGGGIMGAGLKKEAMPIRELLQVCRYL